MVTASENVDVCGGRGKMQKDFEVCAMCFHQGCTFLLVWSRVFPKDSIPFFLYSNIQMRTRHTLGPASFSIPSILPPKKLRGYIRIQSQSTGTLTLDRFIPGGSPIRLATSTKRQDTGGPARGLKGRTGAGAATGTVGLAMPSSKCLLTLSS